MPQRSDNTQARDSSLIPNKELDLAPVVLNNDNDASVDLSGLGFIPLILLVRADGDFLEGADAPNKANDFYRDGGAAHSLAVNGAASWHFKRAGSTTVTVKIKALGAV